MQPAKENKAINSKSPTDYGEGSCVFCPFRYGEEGMDFTTIAKGIQVWHRIG